MNMLRWQQGIDKPCLGILEDVDPTAVAAPELNSTYRQSVSQRIRRAANDSSSGSRAASSVGSHQDVVSDRENATLTIVREGENMPKLNHNTDQMSVQRPPENLGNDPLPNRSNDKGHPIGVDVRRYSKVMENDPPPPLPSIAVYLETVEGSGLKEEVEQSDSPSLENSISPFLHPKDVENRTSDAVSKATVSMVTNVIDENISGQPLRGSDHGEQHSEASFSEEGFIPVISNLVSRNNITTNIRKPFSSIDDFNDTKTTHASHGPTSISGVSSSDVDDHKAAITELPSHTYVSSFPPDLPPPPPPPPHPLQPLPEYVIDAGAHVSYESQCMCSCPCSSASAYVFPMPSPSAMVQSSSEEIEVSLRKEMTKLSNNETLSHSVLLDYNPNITYYDVIQSNLEALNDSDVELNGTDIESHFLSYDDISQNLLPGDGLKLSSTIPTPPLTQLPNTSLSANASTGVESILINATITPSHYDEGLSTMEDVVLTTEVPTNTVEGEREERHPRRTTTLSNAPITLAECLVLLEPTTFYFFFIFFI